MKWTLDEELLAYELHGKGVPDAAIAIALEEVFGTQRSVRSIQSKRGRLKKVLNIVEPYLRNNDS